MGSTAAVSVIANLVMVVNSGGLQRVTSLLFVVLAHLATESSVVRLLLKYSK